MKIDFIFIMNLIRWSELRRFMNYRRYWQMIWGMN